jgi:hypothetical protein
MTLANTKAFRSAPELLWALEDMLEEVEFAYATNPKNPLFEGWDGIIERAKYALELAGHPTPVDTSIATWRDQRKD